MNDKEKLALLGLILIGVLVAAGLYIMSHDIALLNPAGLIATKERQLILTATILMLIVVIPVYLMTFLIVWRYREGNKLAKYRPDWDHHKGLEIAWWAIPGLIILALSLITWRSSHELDPFKKIDSQTKALTVQVIALDWKWLFIYPEQNIASLNYLQLPASTPINFQITADAPMNSLWIPKLGGQIYAMSGMSTKLHLLADKPGNYPGYSANVSGRGFADMTFRTQISPVVDFKQWVGQTQQLNARLNMAAYNKLAKPSTAGVAYFSTIEAGLYDKVMVKYMAPASQMLDVHNHNSAGRGV